MGSKLALTKKSRGLWTAPNRYDVPDGALIKASNVLIRRDGVIEPRWGLEPFSTTAAAGSVDHWHVATSYAGSLWYAGRRTDGASYSVALASTTFAGMNVVATGEDPPDQSSNYTSTTRLPFYDMEFIKTSGNLYYNAFRGLIRLDSSGNARRAGGYPCHVALAPRPISTSLSRSGTTTVTATTAFAHGYQVGITVVMSSAGSADFGAGTYVIVTVPSTTTFTYVDATATSTAGPLNNQVFAAAQFVGSSGILTTNEQVAYRAVLVEYDTNNVEYKGQVSERATLTNAAPAIGTAANKNVQLAVLFGVSSPANNTKFQLYRTKKGTVTPGDEMYKVYEKFLSAADIARGYLWVTDITPDTLTGEALYINAGQEGADRNNVRPACAKTVAVWDNKTVMANTTGFATAEMQLLSTDNAAGGLDVGDGFFLEYDTALTYLFVCVNSGTALSDGRLFIRYSGGTPSVDVQNTVNSLIDTINWGCNLSTSSCSPLSSYIAKFTSIAGDWPGRLAVSRVLPDQYDLDSVTANTRTIAGYSGGSATSRTCWAPTLGEIEQNTALDSVTRAANSVTVTGLVGHRFAVGEHVVVWSGGTGYATQTQLSIAGTAVEGIITSKAANTITFANTGTNGSSTGIVHVVSTKYMPKYNQDTQVNNVAVSKDRQPEAFPPFSTVRVGKAGSKVLKCVPCGLSLLVFKEDGLYRVVDDADGVLRSELLDATAVLWAKDSAAPINSKVMAWLTKGVAIIGEGGVEKYVSERIYDKFAPSTLQTLPFSRRAQAYVDEQNGLYELRVCLAASPAVPYASDTNLTYNIFNDTWVSDTLTAVSEVILNGKRYVQQGTTLYAQGLTTRGAFTEIVPVGGSVNGNFFTLTYTGSNPVLGSTVLTVSQIPGTVVGTGSGQITVYVPNNIATFTTDIIGGDDVSVYAPVVSNIQWAPVTLVEENRLKRFQELQLLWGVADHYVTYVKTSTEMIPTVYTATAYYTSYGSSAGSVSALGFDPHSLRLTVPQQHRLGQQLSVELEIYTASIADLSPGSWTIQAFGVLADVLGPRVGR